MRDERRGGRGDYRVVGGARGGRGLRDGGRRERHCRVAGGAGDRGRERVDTNGESGRENTRRILIM